MRDENFPQYLVDQLKEMSDDEKNILIHIIFNSMNWDGRSQILIELNDNAR